MVVYKHFYTFLSLVLFYCFYLLEYKKGVTLPTIGIILWRVSPMRERLKHGALNQARNRKRTSCYAKFATVAELARLASPPFPSLRVGVT
jgi:hypothetical protein